VVSLRGVWSWVACPIHCEGRCRNRFDALALALLPLPQKATSMAQFCRASLLVPTPPSSFLAPPALCGFPPGLLIFATSRAQWWTHVDQTPGVWINGCGACCCERSATKILSHGGLLKRLGGRKGRRPLHVTCINTTKGHQNLCVRPTRG
jgi:hypothetical protein